jgi:hypothetical protein
MFLAGVLKFVYNVDKDMSNQKGPRIIYFPYRNEKWKGSISGLNRLTPIHSPYPCRRTGRPPLHLYRLLKRLLNSVKRDEIAIAICCDTTSNTKQLSYRYYAIIRDMNEGFRNSSYRGRELPSSLNSKCIRDTRDAHARTSSKQRRLT